MQTLSRIVGGQGSGRQVTNDCLQLFAVPECSAGAREERSVALKQPGMNGGDLRESQCL